MAETGRYPASSGSVLAGVGVIAFVGSADHAENAESDPEEEVLIVEREREDEAEEGAGFAKREAKKKSGLDKTGILIANGTRSADGVGRTKGEGMRSRTRQQRRPNDDAACCRTAAFASIDRVNELQV